MLARKFYLQNTLVVARELLGAILCRKTPEGTFRGVIVETEAYTQEDPSCHAFRGVTKRSAAMFKRGGITYVYFIYGMHHCLNVVTEGENRGCAVLIRAVEPLTENISTKGPSRLCKALNITCELNEIDVTKKSSPIYIEKGEKISDKNVIQTTRIGIKQGADLPWRFYIKDNKWVSKP